MKKSLLTTSLLLFYLLAYPWGSDVFVAPVPSGQSSVVESQGMLYCSGPAGMTGVGGIKIYSSTDMGLTWTDIAQPGAGQNVGKSKLVVTGTDSVYCAYMVDSTVYFYSIASGIVTPFTTIYVEDFDIAPGPTSNSIYLFCEQAGNHDIRRYSSTDGGYTWGGSSALVTSSGANPRVSMSNATLILNYYGPVQPDPTTSVIRSAIYSESAPGQLTSGTFQDLTTSGLSRNQFASIIVGSTVWFIYSEGSPSSVIKYKISTDAGANYGLETTLAGNANINAQCFGVTAYSDVTGSGVMIAYYLDSLGGNMKMNYTSASTLTPTVFIAAETLNDFTPTCNLSILPSITAVGPDAGILFLEDDGIADALYFDLRSFIVGVNELLENRFQVYPNPASSYLKLLNDDGKSVEIKIYDSMGRLVAAQELSVQGGVDVSRLSAGVYYLKAGEQVVRVVKE